MYRSFLDAVILVEDEKCDTLYVTFNSLVDMYEIHYNKKFIIDYAIQMSLFDVGRVDSMITTCAFFLAHEVSHVLRYHMYNQDSLIKNISPKLVNILGDSFINTELSDIFVIDNHPKKFVGLIDNNIKFKGKLKPEHRTGRSLIEGLAELISPGNTLDVDGVNRHKEFTEPDIELQIVYNPRMLETLFQAIS